MRRSQDYEVVARKIVALWGENTEVRAWLEEIALHHENSSVRSAIAKGIAAIELPHVNSQVVQNLGDVYYYQNRLEEAIAVYLNPNLNDTFTSKFGLIQAYTSLKRYDEAITYCKQWIEKEPKSQWAYNSLGDTYQKSGRYGEAISAFNRTLKLAGETSAMAIILLQEGLGGTYQDMGQYESAIATYERAIAIDPASQFNSSIHSSLGMVYHDLGQYEAAISAFQRAIALDSTSRRPHNGLGCLYRELERWEGAIEAFQTAIELDSGSANTYNHLGILFLLQGEFDRAEQEFTTVRQLNPYYGSGILSVGLLQALRGNLTEARATWQRGLVFYGEHALYQRLYRTLYTVALGQAEEGIANLRQILRQEKPPRGLLWQVFEIARLLQRCPEPIDGIPQVVVMLEWGIQHAPIFKRTPNEEV